MHAPGLNVLNQSINTYTHEYPMTLLKIANNSYCFIREFECSVREYRFIPWNVDRTTGKEVRPWLDWPCEFLFGQGFNLENFLRYIFPSVIKIISNIVSL